MAVHTLRDADGLTNVLKLEVSKRHILHESCPASPRTAIVCHGLVKTLPRLDPRPVSGIDKMNVLIYDVLHIVWCERELADRADGHSVCTVASDILGVDVGAVALDRDAVVTFLSVSLGDSGAVALHVITTGDRPIVERDVPRVPRIDTIRVHGEPRIVADRAHENIRHGDILRVRDERVPELALRPAHAI